VDFDPANGRPRAVAGNAQTGVMKAWDLRDNRTLLSVHGPVSRLTRVSFSPDGQYLAAPSDGHTVTLWSIASGQPWRNLSGFGDDVLVAIFSPDGKSLATFSAKEQIVWEVASGKRLIELPAPLGNRVAMTFSPDGQLVAMITAMQTAKVFEVATGRETASLSAAFDVSVLALGPAPRGQAGGMRLAGAGRATTATVWDVPSARSVLTLSVAGRGGEVEFLAFSPDATRLVVDTDLYDATTGAALFSLLGQADVPSRVAFSADGTRLITGGYHGTVRVWDLGVNHELLTVVASSPALGVALSPDGKLLATGDGSRALLTDLASGRTLHTLDGHADTVNSFAFSPDGRLLATGSADRTVMLWDVASGQAIRTLTGYQADRPGIPPIFRGVHAVTFSPACAPERCPVAAIGLDGHLIVWDARSGQTLWTYHRIRGQR
jgi:WD40 repeat protein